MSFDRSDVATRGDATIPGLSDRHAWGGSPSNSPIELNDGEPGKAGGLSAGPDPCRTHKTLPAGNQIRGSTVESRDMGAWREPGRRP